MGISRNWVISALAVLLAIGLQIWFYGPGNSVTVTVPVAIEIENVAPDMMIVSPRGLDNRLIAQVKIRGPAPSVERVKSAKQKFIIDLSGASLKYNAVLDEKQLRLPPAVEVLDVLPTKISFRLEEIVEKELEVVPDTAGGVPGSYKFEGIKVIPNRVFVRGPRSEVEVLKSAFTQQILLSRLSGSQVVSVPLVSPGELSRLNVGSVSVEVAMSEIQAVKSFKGVNVKVVAPYGFAASVEPSKVEAVLTGPSSVLDRLDGSSISLVADGSLLGPGSHRVPLGGTLPGGVSVMETKPDKVNLTLVKSDG